MCGTAFFVLAFLIISCFRPLNDVSVWYQHSSNTSIKGVTKDCAFLVQVVEIKNFSKVLFCMKPRTSVLLLVCGIVAVGLGTVSYLPNSDMPIPKRVDTRFGILSRIERTTISSEQFSLRGSAYGTAPLSVIQESFIKPEHRIAHRSDVAVFPKRINIALCGVDSRIGEGTPHADANHVISIQPDSGYVEIISIPRDTPVPMGNGDTIIIANVRAKNGLVRYLHELETIAHVGRISYHIELGFSQALGIIELLGYKKPQKMLQVLRSRKAFAGGDYQRVYNQGQFIAQSITHNFHRVQGIWGDLLVISGLAFLNTNLAATDALAIIETLRTNGFLTTPQKQITVRTQPRVRIHFQAITFANLAQMDSIQTRIEQYTYAVSNAGTANESSVSDSALFKQRLWTMLAVRATDSTQPRLTIRTLQRPFEQHIWLQIRDTTERREMRRWFGYLLANAYTALGKPKKADGIRAIIQYETALFQLAQ
jgi:hypothetical protein